MPNTISPSATGLPSRRAIMAGGSAAVLGSICTPAHADESSELMIQQDDLAISLWEERSALRPLFIEASRAIKEATARLPDWAKPGPCYLNYDGSLSGQIVGWPAIQDMEPPDRPGVFRLVRPGEEDIQRSYGHSVFTEEQRSNAVRRERSALATRRKAQRAAEKRAGLFAADRAQEALFRRLDVIDEKIDALPNTTPIAVAVRVLTSAMLHSRKNDKIGWSSETEIAIHALEFLRPLLRGIVKDHVDELLDNEGLRVWCCKAYVYGDEEGDSETSQAA